MFLNARVTQLLKKYKLLRQFKVSFNKTDRISIKLFHLIYLAHMYILFFHVIANNEMNFCKFRVKSFYTNA